MPANTNRLTRQPMISVEIDRHIEAPFEDVFDRLSDVDELRALKASLE